MPRHEDLLQQLDHYIAAYDTAWLTRDEARRLIDQAEESQRSIEYELWAAGVAGSNDTIRKANHNLMLMENRQWIHDQATIQTQRPIRDEAERLIHVSLRRIERTRDAIQLYLALLQTRAV